MAGTDAQHLVRVNVVVGSAAEHGWQDRLRSADVDVLRLAQVDAVKSRLRKRTTGGTEVAISLDRGSQLRDGDILFWDAERRAAIVARIDLADVMVIDLTDLARRSQVDAMAASFELGHALGNQHWGVVVKGLRAYVQFAISREVMSTVMRTHAFGGVGYTFAPGKEVLGRLTSEEARRLFGTGQDGAHVHLPSLSPGPEPGPRPLLDREVVR